MTDTELDRLGDFLEGREGGKAMSLEQRDGFFAALIAGPEPVMSSEYNRELFGGESPEFSSLDEAEDILGLLMRHWNIIAGALLKGEVHVPLMPEDKNGVARGNDWAQGFMRGMHIGLSPLFLTVRDERMPMMLHAGGDNRGKDAVILCNDHKINPGEILRQLTGNAHISRLYPAQGQRRHCQGGRT